MKEKLRRFMYGRYGVDNFSKFLLFSALIAFILSRFLLHSFLYIVGLALFIYSYYRIFSRDVYRRYEENQVFLNRSSKFRNWFHRQEALLKQRKVYHIYRCPGCHQKIRIPRGKGKIEICCPKCSHKFIKRS